MVSSRGPSLVRRLLDHDRVEGDPPALSGQDDIPDVAELVDQIDTGRAPVVHDVSRPVLAERLPAQRWHQADDEHYRALVRAATETIAVLVPAPLRRATDPVTVRTRQGPRTYRPCTRAHRLIVLAGLVPVSCTRCRLDPPEGAEHP